MANIKKQNTSIAVNQNTIETLKNIVEHSHRENTKKSYTSALKMFAAYLNVNNYTEISTENILLFLSECSHTHSYNSIKLYFASIMAYANEKQIHTDKNKFKTFFKGLRNVKTGAKGAKALELSQVNEIIKNIPDTLQGKRDKAIILLSFWGAFRRSEIANLDFNNISFDNKGATITVMNSKTDTNKTGIIKAIPYNLSNVNICPVQALKNYLNASCVESGFIFRSIKKAGQTTNDSKLSEIDIYRIIKKYAPDFTPHSLRAGFVTSAAAKGATIQSIMQQTGHKTVQMVAHYTRFTDTWKNNAVNILN